jgi:ornithine carrier protein
MLRSVLAFAAPDCDQYRLAQDALQATVLVGTKDLPLSALVLCGAISGAFTSILLTPIELVKCKMQVPFVKPQDAMRPPGVLSIISSVYRHQGISGFWHGHLGTLIREMGGSAAWFGSYEGGKILFLKWSPHAKTVDDLAVWQRMVAGAIAGMSYNFIFYPADTIKSRMQTQDVRVAKGVDRSFWSVGKALWASHGMRGLYRGCGITVCRAAPSSAVIFTVYEMLRKHFS